MFRVEATGVWARASPREEVGRLRPAGSRAYQLRTRPVALSRLIHHRNRYRHSRLLGAGKPQQRRR